MSDKTSCGCGVAVMMSSQNARLTGKLLEGSILTKHVSYMFCLSFSARRRLLMDSGADREKALEKLGTFPVFFLVMSDVDLIHAWSHGDFKLSARGQTSHLCKVAEDVSAAVSDEGSMD